MHHITAREHYSLVLAERHKNLDVGSHGVDLTAYYERRFAQMSIARNDIEGAARHISEVRRRTFDLG